MSSPSPKEPETRLRNNSKNSFKDENAPSYPKEIEMKLDSNWSIVLNCFALNNTNVEFEKSRSLKLS